MIHFFGNQSNTVFAVQTQNEISSEDINKLNWLFGDANKIDKSVVADFFVGPRAAMVTPWSTNAVEITQNMGISRIIRIEEFQKGSIALSLDFDPMLIAKIFGIKSGNLSPLTIAARTNFRNQMILTTYNLQEGLALSSEEVEYLHNLSNKIRKKINRF